jgi:hypothetical protein
MATQKKLGTLRGVSQWRNLETAGDCKRFFKWLIHSMREKTLDPREASVMALIGSYLLKAVEVADQEARMDKIERHLDEEQDGSASGSFTTH